MNPFRRLSIAQKLMVVIFVTAGVALIVGAGSLSTFQLFRVREDFIADVRTTAELLAYNTSAALAFNDQRVAREMLSAVKAKRYIEQAMLVKTNGSVLAEHNIGQPSDLALFPSRDGVRMDKGHVLCTRVIEMDNEVLGRLCLKADYRRACWSVVPLHIAALGGALLIALTIAMVLSGRLQRLITTPIERLAATARIIADKKDYSVRAVHLADDEIGLFTDAFNQMLSQIQAQDRALNESEARYRLLFQVNPLPIWVYDTTTLRFLAVNEAAIRKYEYTREEFLSRTICDIRPQETIKDLMEYIEKLGTSTAEPALRVHQTKSGKVIDVEVTSNQLTFSGRPARLVLANDVTERLKAERELEAAQRRLVEASRLAGKAEVATGVLHNVGNVLNSVNVSATLIRERVQRWNTEHLRICTGLLAKNMKRLPEFLTKDEEGHVLPGYMVKLADSLAEDQQSVIRELHGLTKNIEHIKEIVSVQQCHAGAGGCRERMPLSAALEDALWINSTSLERHGIEVARDYSPTPEALADRHKVLQILINLLSNAKAALLEVPEGNRRLNLRVFQADDTHAAVSVTDNGVGIPPENLTRIFQHGFTTKKDGHGFGLHSGALAAMEMDGELHVESQGYRHGATFTLKLPIQKATHE